MTKTKQEYIDEFKDFIKDKSNVGKLYKSKAIISQKSFWEEYTKVLLAYCEGDPKKYFDENIGSNEIRENHYNVGHKVSTTKGNPDSKQFQTEVRETMAMINCQDTNPTFKLLDYQVPMKNSNKDREKNIDLVGTAGGSLYILEYKKFESTETLLRSVLECYTYRRLINEGIGSFSLDFGYSGADVIPAILMMKDSKQYDSFKNQKKESPIIKLMENLGVKAFVIEPRGVDFKEDLETKKLLAEKKPMFNFKFDIHEIWI